MSLEKREKSPSARGKMGRQSGVRQSAEPPQPPSTGEVEKKNVALDCGWGRLLFGQTFESAGDLAACIRAEGPGRRDIAFYISRPACRARGCPPGAVPRPLAYLPARSRHLQPGSEALARLLHPPPLLGPGRRGREPHLRRPRHGAGVSGLLLGQARQPRHHLFRRRGREHRRDHRHHYRRRPRRGLRRS